MSTASMRLNGLDSRQAKGGIIHAGAVAIELSAFEVSKIGPMQNPVSPGHSNREGWEDVNWLGGRAATCENRNRLASTRFAKS